MIGAISTWATALLGPLSFTNPWMLAGLLGLPLLWALLRVLPPAPRYITLPTVQFLLGLEAAKTAPHHTPWWILLLRLLIAALVFIALSGPVLNKTIAQPGSGPLLLIMENSWAAGQSWQAQRDTAQNLLAAAERQNRSVYILTTAPADTNIPPLAQGPVSAQNAMAIVQTLRPLPWPADYKGAALELGKLGPDKADETALLSHGLREQGFETLVNALPAGRITFYAPAPEELPALLRPADPADAAAPGIKVAIERPVNSPQSLRYVAQAVSASGQTMEQVETVIQAGTRVTQAEFKMPSSLSHEVSYIRLAGQNHAGGVYFLPRHEGAGEVGIVGIEEHAKSQPLARAEYYLARALKPYAALHFGDIDSLLKRGVAMLVLPDAADMKPATAAALTGWIEDGGVMVRFAGPKTAETDQDPAFLPVPLRTGGRSLDGVMTWERPAHLQAIEGRGPLAGIDIREPIEIRRQILAQPHEGLENKIWAALEDGTPLVTARQSGNGLIVMIHTAAVPDWSDLPLSGAYVEMLRRLAFMAGKTGPAATSKDEIIQPAQILDGFGHIGASPESAKGLSLRTFEEAQPSPSSPPGLYHQQGLLLPLNIGEKLGRLSATTPPPGTVVATYASNREKPLAPLIYCVALLLVFIDTAVMLALSASFKAGGFSRGGALALGLLLPLFIPGVAQAQSDPANLTSPANGFYLGFIEHPQAAQTAVMRSGLENLAAILAARTSVEPQGVLAVNLRSKNLALFPLIYWRVDAATPAPTAEDIKSLQDYMDYGGTLVIDTGDSSNYATPQDALLRVLSGLNMPVLAPLEKDHVLTKSFYLLPLLAVRNPDGAIWVQPGQVSGRDGVSPAILTSYGWAERWSAPLTSRQIPAGSTQAHEMALRFGVNLVMVALTGNYKADQVHVPHILERLGE